MPCLLFMTLLLFRKCIPCTIECKCWSIPPTDARWPLNQTEKPSKITSLTFLLVLPSSAFHQCPLPQQRRRVDFGCPAPQSVRAHSHATVYLSTVPMKTHCTASSTVRQWKRKWFLYISLARVYVLVHAREFSRVRSQYIIVNNLFSARSIV